MPSFNTVFDRPSVDGVSFENYPTKTESYHMDECNLKRIIDRALVNGSFDANVLKEFGKFADATAVDDYATAMRKIAEGNSMFERLPATLRARFHGSPIELLEFVNNPDNKDEAVKLGIFDAKKLAGANAPVGTEALDITVPTDTKTQVEVSQ